MSNDVIILTAASNEVGQNWKDGSGNVYACWPGWPTYTNSSRIYIKPQPWNSGEPIDTTNPGSGTFAVASDPIHSQPNSGVGPGMAMADKYITDKNDSSLNVGLVPCAWSGSYMCSTQWPSWTRQYHYGTPYGMMVARALSAMAWGTLRALCITIGENDGNIANTTPSTLWPYFGEGMLGMIDSFRAEVDIPDLPVIVTVMGPNPNQGAPNWDTVKGWLTNMVGVGNKIAVITPSDTSTVDGVHRTVAACVTLGHQRADALVAMQ